MENIFQFKNSCGRGRKRKRALGGRKGCRRNSCQSFPGTLASAELNRTYTIKAIDARCHQMESFLFTLGCYEGEKITVISIVSDQYIVVIKDARYSIDRNLASSIILEN